MPLDLKGVAGRMDRLAALSLKFGAEVLRFRKGGNDPLLYVERRAYIEALQAAIAGLETARVALARIRMRLEATTDVGEP